MTDVICSLMGMLDIVAGVMVIVGFSSSFIGVGIGIAMIGKGGFSFL